MFCTACNIEINDNCHYLTKLHTVNIKRKVNNIPPTNILEESTQITHPEPDLHKYYSSIKTIEFDSKCFYCDFKGELMDHINAEHTKINNFQLEVCIFSYKMLKCHFCQKMFSNEEKLRTHLQSYFRTKKNDKMVLQIRRPYEIKESRLVKVEESKKVNNVRNQMVKNNIKVSLSMNHQKHFVAHWLQ